MIKNGFFIKNNERIFVIYDSKRRSESTLNITQNNQKSFLFLLGQSTATYSLLNFMGYAGYIIVDACFSQIPNLQKQTKIPLYISNKYPFIYLLTQNKNMDPPDLDTHIGGYQYICELGSGDQGTYLYLVYLVGDGKDHQIAAKVFRNNSDGGYERQVAMLVALQNYNTHNKIHNSNVIRMLCHNPTAQVKLPNTPPTSQKVIFFQNAQRGTLAQYTHLPFSQNMAKVLFKQLLNAIKQLHGVKIAHRDIKSENILFGEGFWMGVGDFGRAAFTERKNGGEVVFGGSVGGKGYQPPEMLSANEEQYGYQEEKYKLPIPHGYTGLQADLFAAGVLLFNLVTRGIPFTQAISTDNSYKFIIAKNYPKFWQKKALNTTITQQFRHLIQSMLEFRPQNRLTLQQIQEHSWLSGTETTHGDYLFEMETRFADNLGDKSQRTRKRREIQQKKTDYFQWVRVRQEMAEQCMMIPVEDNDDRYRSAPVLEKVKLHKIMASQLPFSDKHGLIPVKIHPTVLLAYLENMVKEAEKDKNMFIGNPAGLITPRKYSLLFDEVNYRAIISLVFATKELPEKKQEESDDDEKENEQIDEISVEGQLVRCKDEKVAVDWCKKNGNDFWVSSFLAYANSNLRLLA